LGIISLTLKNMIPGNSVEQASVLYVESLGGCCYYWDYDDYGHTGIVTEGTWYRATDGNAHSDDVQ
jgi:hypothetical protein